MEIGSQTPIESAEVFYFMVTKYDKKKYYSYLESKEWLAIRVELLYTRGCTCEKCKKDFEPQKLQIHHITYDRLFNELPSDLLVVCGKCHMEIHGIDPSKFKKKKKQPKVRKYERYKKDKQGKKGQKVLKKKGLSIYDKIRLAEQKLKSVHRKFKTATYISKPEYDNLVEKITLRIEAMRKQAYVQKQDTKK